LTHNSINSRKKIPCNWKFQPISGEIKDLNFSNPFLESRPLLLDSKKASRKGLFITDIGGHKLQEGKHENGNLKSTSRKERMTLNFSNPFLELQPFVP
jgi:hypothetical protein